MEGGKDFGLGDGLGIKYEERGIFSLGRSCEKAREKRTRADLDSSENLSVRSQGKTLESFVSESLTSSSGDALLLPGVGVDERALGSVDDVVIELDLREAKGGRRRSGFRKEAVSRVEGKTTNSSISETSDDSSSLSESLGGVGRLVKTA